MQMIHFKNFFTSQMKLNENVVSTNDQVICLVQNKKTPCYINLIQITT